MDERTTPEVVPAAVQDEQAPFDDSRKALKFALNANHARIPPPYMNKAMHEVPYRNKKAKSKALQALRDEEARADDERRAGRRLGPGKWPASALDRIHLAGYILHQFATLDRVHQLVLMARLTTATVECTCGNPCCGGWRPVPRWVAHVKELCEVIRQDAIIIANDGAIPGAPMKVGLSTQPELRQRIVQEWSMQQWSSLVDLARRFHLTAMTCSRHRAWIEEWLSTQEQNAWLDVDDLFDRTGITGPFL